MEKDEKSLKTDPDKILSNLKIVPPTGEDDEILVNVSQFEDYRNPLIFKSLKVMTEQSTYSTDKVSNITEQKQNNDVEQQTSNIMTSKKEQVNKQVNNSVNQETETIDQITTDVACTVDQITTDLLAQSMLMLGKKTNLTSTTGGSAKKYNRL